MEAQTQQQLLFENVLDKRELEINYTAGSSDCIFSNGTASPSGMYLINRDRLIPYIYTYTYDQRKSYVGWATILTVLSGFFVLFFGGQGVIQSWILLWSSRFLK